MTTAGGAARADESAQTPLSSRQVALALVGYPVAYYVVYHGPPVALFGAHSNDER